MNKGSKGGSRSSCKCCRRSCSRSSSPSTSSSRTSPTTGNGGSSTPSRVSILGFEVATEGRRSGPRPGAPRTGSYGCRDTSMESLVPIPTRVPLVLPTSLGPHPSKRTSGPTTTTVYREKTEDVYLPIYFRLHRSLCDHRDRALVKSNQYMLDVVVEFGELE